jgi:hypothetical protein
MIITGGHQWAWRETVKIDDTEWIGRHLVCKHCHATLTLDTLDEDKIDYTFSRWELAYVPTGKNNEKRFRLYCPRCHERILFKMPLILPFRCVEQE